LIVLPTGTHPSFRLNLIVVEVLRLAGWQLEHRDTMLRGNEKAGSSNFLGGHVRTTHALRFNSEETEVRSVLTRVKELLHAGQSPDTIALIARDDALYGPLIHDVAWEYEVPVKASYARPLRDTPFGAWLDLLVTVLKEDYRFEEMAKLLSHPLCARLPREVWAQLRVQRPMGRSAWLEQLPDLTCLAWPEHAPLAEYSDCLLSVLDRLGAAERAAASARDLMALRKVQRALESLVAVTPEPLPLGAFLDNVGELLTLLTLPADVNVEGVELHTPLAVFGARYEHVFVLGMAEGMLPAALRDDPVLDFYERKALARQGLELEGASEAAHRETLSFWAALQTATSSLTLSYLQRIGGRALLQSSYFDLLGLSPERPADKVPASAEEYRQAQLRCEAAPTDDVMTAARTAWEVEMRREGAQAHDHYDGVTGVAADPTAWRFSASQLVTLGSCPFSWFARKLLELAESEEADDELRPTLRGALYHDTLERTLRRAKDAPDLRAAALSALEEAFAEAEAEVGAIRLPNWPRQRRQHLAALRRVLSADDFFPDGTSIAVLERTFEGTWRGLRVRGVVDRVDRTPDGLVFYDYKTSGSKPLGAKDAEGERKLDLQLPLYVQAAAEVLFPDEDVAGASYYSLTKAKGLPDVKIDDEALEAFVERVKGHLEEGAYPVDPDAKGTVCTYCEFDLLCRNGPRVARKRSGTSA
jgi:ATP-dependent helicase/DNAse subunit B